MNSRKMAPPFWQWLSRHRHCGFCPCLLSLASLPTGEGGKNSTTPVLHPNPCAKELRSGKEHWESTLVSEDPGRKPVIFVTPRHSLLLNVGYLKIMFVEQIKRKITSFTWAEQDQELQTHKLSLIKLEGTESDHELLCEVQEVVECGFGVWDDGRVVHLQHRRIMAVTTNRTSTRKIPGAC